ncbi:NotI family restriction endonuclease [Photorhabdus asymbiotica]|uniref:NotI family restriction endonuclease n=1 Tax=Photorhabdus asymbiotica TaxID=291112 RepID=UPI003DA723FD
MARAPIPRYGIAEWFGNDMTAMTPEERQSFGQLAAIQDATGDISNAPICPFISTLVPNARCNKASGVCSIRRYASGPDGVGVPVPGDKVVTVCPSRFLQTLDNEKTPFIWIAEKMLDIKNPTVVKETPFLRKVSDSIADATVSDDEGDGKKAGRIDWIIVNPTTMEVGELEWCAVETQALYFSGDKMRPEFDAYAKAPAPVLFPVGRRRPDYRSSGPKRLSPQLDVKVPVLRNWGKKVVVVIDRYFYSNMNALTDAYPRARNDQEKRDNSDVVWFVVDYDESLNMTASEVIYTTLESSRRALNATEPLSKADFTRNLKQVIDDKSRANKVFKAS